MNIKQTYQYVKAHIQSGAYDLSGRELFMACPGCGNDSHFSVNLSNGKFNCFKCTVGGKLAGEIANDRLNWRRLTGNLLDSDFLSNRSTPGRKIDLPKNAYIIHSALYSDGNSPRKKHVNNSLSLCERAFIYCQKRGLTKEQIKKYRVFIKPMDPRVYFPYWNRYGEITYFMGRKMMGVQDVMKTKDVEDTEKPLFGRQVEVLRDRVILVEGVFDHFVTKSSYALMGSSVSTAHIMQLREDGVKTVYVLGDPDASLTAENNARKLRNFKFNAFPVFMHTKGRDPGDLGRDRMDEVVKELFSKVRRVFTPIHITYAK